MNKTKIPLTINLHSIIPCNYRCGFCYAGFPGIGRTAILQPELHEILRQIARIPLPANRLARKVTFVGGEPLLSRTLLDDVGYAKQLGLITAIVTNGSRLFPDTLEKLAPVLDWLTISIDSLVPEINVRIGRQERNMSLTSADYMAKFEGAKALGIRTKINTVVCRYNVEEDFTSFLRIVKPKRWKILQVTRVAEENGSDFENWAVSKEEFNDFIERHASLNSEDITLVPETQEEVYGTYAMVGPNGCFFDNSKGCYTYSRPISQVGLQRAFEEISFSDEGFQRRQGDYDFNTGLNRLNR